MRPPRGSWYSASSILEALRLFFFWFSDVKYFLSDSISITWFVPCWTIPVSAFKENNGQCVNEEYNVSAYHLSACCSHHHFSQQIMKKSKKSEWTYSHQLHWSCWKSLTSSFKWLPLHNSPLAEITALFLRGLNIIFVLQHDFVTIQIASKLHIPTAPPTPAVYFKYLHRFLFNLQTRLSHHKWDFNTHCFRKASPYFIRCWSIIGCKFTNTFFLVFFSSYFMLWIL